MRLDPVDDVLDVEVARVDLERVLGGLHPGAVAVVAGAQVGRECVGADVGTLGLAALLAHAAFGDEIDLHVRVRADDRADVAPFDHGVAELRRAPAGARA